MGVTTIQPSGGGGLRAPDTPATRNGGLNGTNNAGSLFLQFIFEQATGEPNPMTGPYYLHLSDGDEHEEYVVVVERVSNGTRRLATPLAYTWSAGSNIFAYAGPASKGSVTLGELTAGPRKRLAEIDALADDAIVDADFSGGYEGDLTRISPGTYAARRNNLDATVAPTSSDNDADGYAVGSVWVQLGVSVFICTEITSGFAVWKRLASLATSGTPEEVGETGSLGSSALGAAADHVHAHGDLPGGSMHALASDTDPGFLSPEEKDLLNGRKQKILLFEDEFVGNIDPWRLGVTGAGASVVLTAAAAAHPGGRVSLETGTTATGIAELTTARNLFYSSSCLELRQTVIARLIALSDGTDDFRAWLCAVTGSSLSQGYALLYDPAVSLNWQLVRYSGGVVAGAADTGVVAGTTESRWETLYDRANDRALAYCDGVQVAELGSIGVIGAQYLIPGRIEKTLGTTASIMVIDYARAILTPAAGARV